MAWPARDRNGSTNGEGVLVGLEVSAQTGGGATSATTMLYTNSAGTNTRTATMASFPATAQVGTFVPFQLDAGDIGVRSIQEITLGVSYVSGTIHLVAYRILAEFRVVAAESTDRDAMQLGFPKLYDNTVPYILWRPTATTATIIDGRMTVSQA